MKKSTRRDFLLATMLVSILVLISISFGLIEYLYPFYDNSYNLTLDQYNQLNNYVGWRMCLAFLVGCLTTLLTMFIVKWGRKRK